MASYLREKGAGSSIKQGLRLLGDLLLTQLLT